jgi:hypothetical protein
MSTELEEKLAKARALYREGNFRDPLFLQLARTDYPPARSLACEMLDDPALEVRSVALQMLLRSKSLASDSGALDKVRGVLTHDPDAMIRMKAATVLGSHSTWPDPALEHAVENETDRLAREAAFLAVLERMVSFDFADQYRHSVGTLEVSMATARRLVAEHAEKQGKT